MPAPVQAAFRCIGGQLSAASEHCTGQTCGIDARMHVTWRAEKVDRNAFLGADADGVAGDADAVIHDQDTVQVNERRFGDDFALAGHAESAKVFADEGSASFYDEIHRILLLVLRLLVIDGSR